MTRKEKILEDLSNDEEKLINMLAVYDFCSTEIEKTKKNTEYKTVLEEKIKQLSEEV